MTERLITAFAALAERGTVAGADAVWQRAVLAAAVDGPSQLSPGEDSSPLVPVVRRGEPVTSEWIEVREGGPFTARHGRRRIGVAVGLSAAAVLALGASVVVLGDGDGDHLPGGPPGEPASTSTMTTLLAETSAPTVENTATTAILSPNDPLGSMAEYGFATGQPCPGGGEQDRPAATSVPSLSTQPTGTEFPPTTPGGSMSGYSPLGCVYTGGTLPPVTDGPGSDWASSPATLPGDAALVYWRMLDDLDITWRQEGDGVHVYWRTPAGQGSAPDAFGGAAVLMVPAAGRYIVLARTGPTVSGAPGQRPLQAQAVLADGTTTVAPLVYDNDLGLGHAYLETTQSVVQVLAL